MPIDQSIEVDRELTPDEVILVMWLLEHGEPRAADVVSQLRGARVVSRCGCGCASIDFSVDGIRPSALAGMDVVSDYWWRTAQGNLCGAFVFLRNGVLAGLDLWSIDGAETPSVLPRPEDLRPQSQFHDD